MLKFNTNSAVPVFEVATARSAVYIKWRGAQAECVCNVVTFMCERHVTGCSAYCATVCLRKINSRLRRIRNQSTVTCFNSFIRFYVHFCYYDINVYMLTLNQYQLS